MPSGSQQQSAVQAESRPGWCDTDGRGASYSFPQFPPSRSWWHQALGQGRAVLFFKSLLGIHFGCLVLLGAEHRKKIFKNKGLKVSDKIFNPPQEFYLPTCPPLHPSQPAHPGLGAEGWDSAAWAASEHILLNRTAVLLGRKQREASSRISHA